LISCVSIAYSLIAVESLPNLAGGDECREPQSGFGAAYLTYEAIDHTKYGVLLL